MIHKSICSLFEVGNILVVAWNNEMAFIPRFLKLEICVSDQSDFLTENPYEKPLDIHCIYAYHQSSYFLKIPIRKNLKPSTNAPEASFAAPTTISIYWCTSI